MKSKKVKDKKSRSSFKELLKMYRKVKIPWLLVIGSMLLSIVYKEAQSSLVPYVSKLEMGLIDESGFLGGFIMLTIAVAFIEAVQGAANELGSVMMARNVRRTLWGKLIRLPMSLYDKIEPQKFVSRVTQDTTGAYAAITVTVQIISVGYGIYTNFMKMYKTYDTIALIMLTGIPMTFIAAYFSGKLEYRINEIVNNSYSVVTNFFGERLPNLLHIKTSNMDEEEYKNGIKASNDRYKAEVRKLNLFIIQAPIPTFAQYINEVVLLVVASSLVRAGTMRMAQLINLYNYYLLFMGNAIMLNAIWQGIKRSHGSCETIAPLINMEDEKLDGEAFDSENEDIRFENVSFSYGERKVLENINFAIPSGKITAIVGENGCGKSTLIKLLEGFIEPDSGKIYLGGKDMKEISLSQWRQNVGYLFQGNQIVKGSIRENICYGLGRESSDEEIENAAKLACAYDFIKDREDGLDSQISRFDSKLSGGELQRLAIARIILKKPAYLIMDEATSGIDMLSEKQVMQGINKIMDGKTVIMVSHDLNLIKRADNIVILNNGKVEANGSYGEVLKNSELFQRFCETSSARGEEACLTV